jgi:hypothetical protein
MLRVGGCYAGGDGVPEDSAQGFAWIKRASDAGLPLATYNLGLCYEKGIGVVANPVLASAAFEKAAKAGQVDAILKCASVALDRSEKAAQKSDLHAWGTYQAAWERWLNEAVDAGSFLGMLHLALAERSRLPVRGGPSFAESFRLTKQAAESGLWVSLYELALHHAAGVGCEVDMVAAEKRLGEALAAAKRDGNDEGITEVTKALAAKGGKEREALAREALGVDQAAAVAAAVGKTLDRGLVVPGPADGLVPPRARRARRPAASATPELRADLFLLDVTVNPSGIAGMLTVDGRARNVSDSPLEFVRVTVAFEDRGGRLLATTMTFLTPSPIPPGGFATFKALDKLLPGTDHIKLDFAMKAGESVPWVDKSGKGVHQ